MIFLNFDEDVKIQQNASAPKEHPPHNLQKDDQLMQKAVVGTKDKLNCAFVHKFEFKSCINISFSC